MPTRLARFLAVLAAVAFVPACGSDDDDEPLSVSFVSPAHGTGGVPRQPVIYVRFNRPLDPATVVDQGTVFLLTSLSASIPIGVEYDDCLNEIRVVPDAALDKSAVYQVSLTNGITDTSDIPYGGGFFQFTIGTSDDAARPAFGGATAAGSPTSTSIALTWTAATDASGIVYDVFLSTETGCYDFTDPFLADQPSGTGVTVTGLSPSTTYFFVVRSRDAFGNVDLNITEQSATTTP